MSIPQYCQDCHQRTDCQMCEVCRALICQDCDHAHDCLSQAVDDLTDEQAEELMIDAMFADDDEEGGNA